MIIVIAVEAFILWFLWRWQVINDLPSFLVALGAGFIIALVVSAAGNDAPAPEHQATIPELLLKQDPKDYRPQIKAPQRPAQDQMPVFTAPPQPLIRVSKPVIKAIPAPAVKSLPEYTQAPRLPSGGETVDGEWWEE